MKEHFIRVHLLNELGECLGEIAKNILATVMMDAGFEELSKNKPKEDFEEPLKALGNNDEINKYVQLIVESGKSINLPEMMPVLEYFKEKVLQFAKEKDIYLESIKKQYRLKYEV